MNVNQLALDQDKARELFDRYNEHRAGYTEADREIAAIYKHIAQGKTVIRALESIRQAGCDEQGLPKLAIAPAHLSECWYHVNAAGTERGNVTFGKRSPNTRDRKDVVRMDWPAVPAPARWSYCAAVPLIPVHLRPKAALHNYHVLWEAEWTKRYPVDPYLLRRFGGDAWLVVAAWDLTDVERAVMQSRLNA
jgi:hypothetical protein